MLDCLLGPFLLFLTLSSSPFPSSPQTCSDLFILEFWYFKCESLHPACFYDINIIFITFINKAYSYVCICEHHYHSFVSPLQQFFKHFLHGGSGGNELPQPLFDCERRFSFWRTTLAHLGFLVGCLVFQQLKSLTQFFAGLEGVTEESLDALMGILSCVIF